ncbi:MAG: exopolysaccharide biosynthesis polyprenyl glycosylphosphotransferase [Ornithinimicrobium sp.]
MRPPRLLNSRSRRGRRHSSYAFRLIDLIVTSALTLALIAVSAPGALVDARVGDILAYLIGWACLVGSLSTLRLYRLRRQERLGAHLSRTVAAAFIGGLAALVTDWALDGSADQAALLLWTAACGATVLGLHLLWWLLVRRWRAQGWLTPNIVIVGATHLAAELVREALERRDMHILGVFDDRAERARMDDVGVPVLGTTRDLMEHRIISSVDLIVVAVDPSATSRVREISSRLAVLPNEVTLVFDHPGATERAMAITRLGDSPLAPLRRVDPERVAFIKRVQDLMLAVPLLVVLAPVLALIAAAIRLDSPGPVFFRQQRHGFNNEEIVVWKFRTMRQEAADQRAERQVSAGDDRVTRVGRVLRKTSLDEFPQLLNVIAGEMSLVGPRPHAVGMLTGDVQSAQLIAEYAHRHRIKPGVTGWAAVQGSRGPMHTPAEVIRRVELDIEYIDRHTFWLDLWIMLLTVPSVLGDRSTVR